MVNVGGPSKGCTTCIQRKIRCGRQRPVCQQCIKSRRHCGGYREASELIFRDQSQGVRTKQEALSSREQLASSRPSPTYSPPLNENDTITHFFVNNFASTDPLETRSAILWIPRDFSDLLKLDCVRWSAQCTGAIAFARLQRSHDYAQKAHVQYSGALQSVSAACQQAISTGDHTSLISVLFLGFFEILSAHEASSVQAWRTHVDGLKTIIAQCREHFIGTHFGEQLLRQTRAQLIVYALRTSTAINSRIARGLSFASSGALEHVDHCDMLLIRLANLKAACRVSPTAGLLVQVMALDQDLLHWQHNVPTDWLFAIRPCDYHTGLWWDSRNDVYQSGFIAYLWNKIRSARIVAYNLRQTLTLQLSEAERTPTYDVEHPNIRDLVGDICATIPTYYRPGHVMCGRAPSMSTAFYFFWPLEVIAASTTSSRELGRWIVACIERIYDSTGILQARSLIKRLQDAQ